MRWRLIKSHCLVWVEGLLLICPEQITGTCFRSSLPGSPINLVCFGENNCQQISIHVGNCFAVGTVLPTEDISSVSLGSTRARGCAQRKQICVYWCDGGCLKRRLRNCFILLIFSGWASIDFKCYRHEALKIKNWFEDAATKDMSCVRAAWT